MISSRKNFYLKNIRRLLRSKDEALILEGPHLVGEALAAGLVLDIVLATPAFLSGEPGQDLLPRLTRRPLEIEPALLDEITDSDSPRGILAVSPAPTRHLETLPRSPGGIYVFAEGIQDPGNLGALARVVEASGSTGLVLGPGTVHPHHPRALRGSAGSLLRLPVLRGLHLEQLCDHLADLHPRRMALIADGGDNFYEALANEEALADETIILLLGGEGPGLSAPTLDAADQRITIPLEPPVESLNATVALAVALFELRRLRHQQAGTSRTMV